MRVFACILVIIGMGLGSAHAHRQPEMVSTVSYIIADDGQKRTQVVHRVHAHDAMKIQSLWSGTEIANLDHPDTLARLGRELSAQISIDGQGVIIGEEVERNYLFVYVEYEGHPPLSGGKGLAMLSDAWTHRVDITDPNGMIASHHFSRANGSRIELAPRSP